jgi:hypothetical protein
MSADRIGRVNGAVRALGALAGALLLGVGGCTSAVTPVVGCTAGDGIEPICEFQNPEDIVATPSGAWLLVSQMGGMDGRLAGSVAAFEPENGRVEVLFPVGEFDDVRDWGDPACPPPSIIDFSPHGIDLDTRANGQLQLLAINHGGRESVEFFEVEQSDAGLALHWRGCVIGPDDAFFNDVVTRRDGGFWVTQMLAKHGQLWALFTAAVFGANTGKVYRWTSGDGFVVEPGSEFPFPNGIEKGPDDAMLYVTSFMGDEVVRLDLSRGEVTARTTVRRPDNLTWGIDGKLLVASHTDSFFETIKCRDLPQGSCGSAFEVVTIDPQTMAQFVMLAHRGAPIGGVSVATQVGENLYLGSVASDRIARWHVFGATP